MNPLTTSPDVVESSALPNALFASGGSLVGQETGTYWGPFLFGSAQYIIGFTNNVSSPRYLGAWKRTTSTWAEVGQNRSVPPQSTAVPGILNAGQCYFDISAGKIWLLYRDSASKPTIVDFDCNTDAWGTPGSTLTLGGSQFWSIANGQQFFRQADGTFYVFYYRNTGTQGVYQLTYTAGGGWSSETIIFTAGSSPSGLVLSGVMDSSERKHIFFWYRDSTVGSNAVRHMFVDSSGTASSVTVIKTNPASSAYDDIVSGRAVIWNESVVFCSSYVISPPTPTTTYIDVHVGTPLSAPVFVTTEVYSESIAVGTIAIEDPSLVVGTDGTLHLLFLVYDGSEDMPMWAFSNDGSGWDAGTIIYNIDGSFPMPNWHTTQGAGPYFGFAAAEQFSTGGWLMLFYGDPGGSARTGLYYVVTQLIGCLYRAIQS